MSMPDENFDELRKLLNCKRYEQPPPGYFVSFSDKVVARIEAQPSAEYSSWWSWFIDRFDAKPILVCAYGLAVSGVLLTGFRLSQAFEADAATVQSINGTLLAATPMSPFLAPVFDPEFNGTPASLSVPGSRLMFHEDAAHLPLPGGSLRFQPVGHSLDGW